MGPRPSPGGAVAISDRTTSHSDDLGFPARDKRPRQRTARLIKNIMHSRTRTTHRSRLPRPQGPWKHGPIPVIGLIGAIGGGKSQVASLLAARGAFVLDADAVGHELLNQRPVRERVVARFGNAILAPGSDESAPPTINRRALGAIVFADPAALRDLETILHPRMRKTFERAIARTVRRGRAPAVVLDAAILLEAGWDSLCDRVVFVDAPRDQRLTRLAAQRGWSDETLAARERAQWPAERKRGMADTLVLNDAGLDQLETAVTRLWESLRSPQRSDSSPGTARPGPRQPGAPTRERPTSDPAVAPRRQ
jgi:dephospho-CoA kinase